MKPKKFIKSKELKKIKELIPKINKDKIYYKCDIFYQLDYFFKHHPAYNYKIKNGKKGYVYSNNIGWNNKNNYCFFIIDNFNNKIEISYNFKINQNINTIIKEEVTKAFRTSILSEILKFKKKFIPNLTKCEITGEVIKCSEDLHIDHHNYDFVIIIDLFLKKYNKTFNDLYQYVIEINTVRYFNNKDLINYFIDFHNKNTTLRFTKKEANLKKEKQIK